MKKIQSIALRHLALLGCAALLLGMLAWRLWSLDKDANADAQPLAVTTAAAAYQQKEAALPLNGTVEGMTSSIISSRFSGRIESVAVENGQKVSAEEVLLTLDGTELNNAVRVAQNNVRQQEASCAQQRADLERNRSLFAISAISRQKMEASETSYVASLSALDNAKAELANALKQQADGSITAPVHGVVAGKAANPGQIVSAGVTLMTVEAIDSVYVTVNVAQKDIAKTLLGTEASVRVDTYPTEVFRGVVAVINPVAGQENRMFQVKIKVDNPEGKLLPGMFAETSIHAGAPMQVLAVPRSAVQTAKGLSYVFVNEKGHASKRLVETGSLLGEMMEITQGLQEGDCVVLDNLDIIKDGDALLATDGEGGAL